MAVLANGPVKLSVGRDLLHIRGRPAPNDPGTVLNMLLMACLARHPFMRTSLPRLPGRFHDMAGTTEIRIILNIVIESIATKHDTKAQQDQEYNNNIPKTIHRHS